MEHKEMINTKTASFRDRCLLASMRTRKTALDGRMEILRHVLIANQHHSSEQVPRRRASSSGIFHRIIENLLTSPQALQDILASSRFTTRDYGLQRSEGKKENVDSIPRKFCSFVQRDCWFFTHFLNSATCLPIFRSVACLSLHVIELLLHLPQCVSSTLLPFVYSYFESQIGVSNLMSASSILFSNHLQGSRHRPAATTAVDI